MSKKTERDEQVRKARLARPTQQERAAELPARSVDAPRLRKRRKPLSRPVFWSLVVAGPVVAFVCFCFLVSVIWPPMVPTPGAFMPAIGATVQILNPSVLPVYRVEYSCALQSLTDQSGFAVGSTEASNVKEQRTVLYRGNRADVECQGRVNMQGIRVRTAESVVTVSYVPFGWPFRRKAEYRVDADLDPIGNVRRWTVQ